LCFEKCETSPTFFEVFDEDKKYIFQYTFKNFTKAVRFIGAKVYVVFDQVAFSQDIISNENKLIDTNSLACDGKGFIAKDEGRVCQVPTEDPEKSNTCSSTSVVSNSSSPVLVSSNLGSTVSVTSNSNNSNTDNSTSTISNSNNITNIFKIIVVPVSPKANSAATLIIEESSSSSVSNDESEDESEAGSNEEFDDQPEADISTPIPTNAELNIVNNINTLVTQIGSSSPRGSSDGESVEVITEEIDSSSNTVTKGEKVMFISAVLVLLIAAGAAFL
jgi:hypothetical protein